MVKLLTGYTGVNIFAEDDQDLYKGIVGSGSVVFSVGSELGLTVSASNNAVTATIADGAFSHKGRIVRVATDEPVGLSVPENGKYRKCEIVARYAINSVTYVESVTLTPLYSSGDSDTKEGAKELPISTTANDFPLYSFVYSSTGMNMDTKTQLFEVVPCLTDLKEMIDEERAEREQAIFDLRGISIEVETNESDIPTSKSSTANGTFAGRMMMCVARVLWNNGAGPYDVVVLCNRSNASELSSGTVTDSMKITVIDYHGAITGSSVIELNVDAEYNAERDETKLFFYTVPMVHVLSCKRITFYGYKR